MLRGEETRSKEVEGGDVDIGEALSAAKEEDIAPDVAITGVVGRELLLSASFSWPIGKEADALRDDDELDGGSGDKGRRKEDMLRGTPGLYFSLSQCGSRGFPAGVSEAMMSNILEPPTNQRPTCFFSQKLAASDARSCFSLAALCTLSSAEPTCWSTFCA